MRTQRVHLPAGTSARADRLIADTFEDLSRRSLRRLMEEGAVRIDGRRVRKGEWLHGERTLEVEVPDLDALAVPPELEPAVPVLFEDARCVALDKPAGRPGHALRSGERGTVAGFLAARFPECVTAGHTPLEAGLVHRLDTDTSGVLLAARDHDSWSALRAQFRAASIEKRYLAVVAGDLATAGETHRPIAPGSRRTVRVLGERESAPDARPATTRYRPLRRSAAATLLAVEISTGVMHQIRAHLAVLGHAVVGDVLYGGPAAPEGRHLLHAASIAFDLPGSSRRVMVESPIPADFAAALRRLGLDRG
jgi:23S rRNA pseudouridine1911/1915/1917 synthase